MKLWEMALVLCAMLILTMMGFVTVKTIVLAHLMTVESAWATERLVRGVPTRAQSTTIQLPQKMMVLVRSISVIPVQGTSLPMDTLGLMTF
jgi:hypothetical protein